VTAVLRLAANPDGGFCCEWGNSENLSTWGGFKGLCVGGQGGGKGPNVGGLCLGAEAVGGVGFRGGGITVS